MSFSLEGLARRGEGDFDGDGIPDELSVEYFRMAPLFRRYTAGMVYIRSGRTGKVLLAHAVSTPLNPAFWVGDLDGNGTDDIVVHDGDGGRTWWVALGYRGRSR